MSKLGTTLFMFRSGSTDGLNAFALAASGVTLPEKFAPWIPTGKVLPGRAPPHGFNRQAIEKGVALAGYQLWRTKNPEADKLKADKLKADKAAKAKVAKAAKAAAAAATPEAEPAEG